MTSTIVDEITLPEVADLSVGKKRYDVWTHLSMGLKSLYNTIEHTLKIDRPSLIEYIECLMPSHFPTGVAFIKGEDDCRRRFISFLVKANWVGTNQPDHVTVVTVYQRASVHSDFWLPAGNWGDVLLSEKENVVDLDRVMALMSGEEVTRRNYFGSRRIRMVVP